MSAEAIRFVPAEVAASVIDGLEGRAADVCEAMRAEQAAIAERDELLVALTNSLIGQPNPMTNKPHSQSSAEAVAKESESYKAAQAKRIEAECVRIMAGARYEQAKLTARLSVAVVGGTD